MRSKRSVTSSTRACRLSVPAGSSRSPFGPLAGCFYCQAVYSPNEITDWTDDDQTALCAKCGIDSVIGAKSGFPITPEFLAEMNRYWF
jgi:hypothetical protein